MYRYSTKYQTFDYLTLGHTYKSQFAKCRDTCNFWGTVKWLSAVIVLVRNVPGKNEFMPNPRGAARQCFVSGFNVPMHVLVYSINWD